MDQQRLLDVVSDIYAKRGVAADQLPYTEEFEEQYAEVVRRTACGMTKSQFWRMLANARKRGALPRLKR